MPCGPSTYFAEHLLAGAALAIITGVRWPIIAAVILGKEAYDQSCGACPVDSMFDLLAGCIGALYITMLAQIRLWRKYRHETY